MTGAEQIAALQVAMQIVSQRGDSVTASRIAPHIANLSIDIAIGFDPKAKPGKRLIRLTEFDQ